MFRQPFIACQVEFAMGEKTIITLQAPEDSLLPVDDIVAWILESFTESYIVHENSYEAERERYTSHYKRWAEQDAVNDNLSRGYELIIRSSLGKELRNGSSKDIIIPIETAESIHGKVAGRSVLFFTDLPLCDAYVQRLGNYLKSLQLGETDIYTDDDN